MASLEGRRLVYGPGRRCEKYQTKPNYRGESRSFQNRGGENRRETSSSSVLSRCGEGPRMAPTPEPRNAKQTHFHEQSRGFLRGDGGARQHPSRSARLSRNPGATIAPTGLPRGKTRGRDEGKMRKQTHCEPRRAMVLSAARRTSRITLKMENKPITWQENKWRNIAPMLMDSARPRHRVMAKSRRHCQLDRAPC